MNRISLTLFLLSFGIFTAQESVNQITDTGFKVKLKYIKGTSCIYQSKGLIYLLDDSRGGVEGLMIGSNKITNLYCRLFGRVHYFGDYKFHNLDDKYNTMYGINGGKIEFGQLPERYYNDQSYDKSKGNLAGNISHGMNDMGNIEVKSGSKIETFRAVSNESGRRFDKVFHDSKSYVFLATSTLNNSYTLFSNLKDDNVSTKKINILPTLTDLFNSNNFGALKKLKINSYWKDYRNSYMVLECRTVKSKKLYVYAIIDTENKINTYLIDDAQYSSSDYEFYFLRNYKSLISVKQSKAGYHLSSFSVRGDIRWTTIRKKFSKLNDVVAENGFMILGGATDKDGYVGYDNPYIEVLDFNNGKMISNYTIARKSGMIYDLSIGRISGVIMTYGDNDTAPTKRLTDSSYLIKDSLNDDGKFENDLFRD
ncbi:hypothetical protein [Psychroserpens sp.]